MALFHNLAGPRSPTEAVGRAFDRDKEHAMLGLDPAGISRDDDGITGS
jgi:hypothetical protein